MIVIEVVGMFQDVTYCSCGEFHSSGMWIHPERVIDSYEVIFVTRGVFEMEEDGSLFSMRPGSVLLLQPDRRHRGLGESENVSFYWLHFRNGGKPAIPVYTENNESFHFTLLWRQLLHFSQLADYGSEGLDYLTRLLLMELRQSLPDSGDTVVHRAAAWIYAERRRPVRAAEVAQTLGYHPDYLNRAFRSVYGCSIKEYIDRTRMDFIRNRLLNTGDSLQTVAAEAGFTDYKYFLKFFRNREGITPTQFRNLYAKTHINIR